MAVVTVYVQQRRCVPHVQALRVYGRRRQARRWAYAWRPVGPGAGTTSAPLLML